MDFQMYGFASLGSRSAPLYLTAFALIVFSCVAAAPEQAAAQQRVPGSIQGFVAVSVPEQFPPAATTGTIFVPDIKVTALNAQTGAVSAQVVTNPQGYF